MADALGNIDDISEDLLLVLELVLLRVPSPACLVRGAAVCKLWRRVIADASFLRLYGSLHKKPVVAGYYFNSYRRCTYPESADSVTSFRPSFVPSPTTTALNIDACRHFSLDFLPDIPYRDWKILDSRGSLLLVRCTQHDPARFPDKLLVCEPLARCYKRIPPPPHLCYKCQLLGFYLVDGNAADGDGVAGGCCIIGMSNFRVLCEVYCDGTTRAAVFTGSADSWSDKAIGNIRGLHHTRPFGRAGGTWYVLNGHRELVGLDGHTGDYSSFVLPTTQEWPSSLWNNAIYITDGRDGKPRIFSAVDNTMKVFARGLDGGEWVLEKKVALQEAARGLPGYKPSFFNRPLSVRAWMPGFVTLIARATEPWLFSVDLETMEVKPAAAEDMIHIMYQCELPWPPALHACL